jgi:hypothetical protein
VNGGNWNNNPSANPTTGSNGIVIIGGPFYPVLCPAYEGTMIVQNSPAYSVPSGYNFLATLSSVGFFQTIGFSDSEFVQLANVVSNSNYTTASEASLGLTANGFWNSYVVPNVTPTPTGTPTSTPTGTPVAETPTPTPTSTSLDITPTPTGTPAGVTPTPTSTPTMYYYNVSGYSCGVSCSLVGSYNVMSPTPLTIGYFYNNPENRGYTFEILSLISAVGGAYDLTGEP